MHNPVRNIADTARWVAVYRADETDRPDALFRDPYARQLAGNRGEDIVQAMEEGRKNNWSFVARTLLFDDFIIKHAYNGYNQILNLASGLDTRPYRLDLPPGLLWIDIDLPETIDYMNDQMKNHSSNCHLQRIALNLSSRKERISVFHSLAQPGKKTLVMAEGLIGYLLEDDAGALAYDLARVPGFQRWVVDLMSPGILPLINAEMGNLLNEAHSPLVFAPEEGEDFFRLFGWTPLESRSKLKTAAGFGRLPGDLKKFAALPEPDGPKQSFPWSGVCLFDNNTSNRIL